MEEYDTGIGGASMTRIRKKSTRSKTPPEDFTADYASMQVSAHKDAVSVGKTLPQAASPRNGAEPKQEEVTTARLVRRLASRRPGSGFQEPLNSSDGVILVNLPDQGWGADGRSLADVNSSGVPAQLSGNYSVCIIAEQALYHFDRDEDRDYGISIRDPKRVNRAAELSVHCASRWRRQPSDAGP